jgi:hypothetical protein
MDDAIKVKIFGRIGKFDAAGATGFGSGEVALGNNKGL